MTAAGKPLKAYTGAKVATRLLPSGIGPFEGTAEQATDYKPAIMWDFVPFVSFDPFKPPKTLSHIKEDLTEPEKVRPQPIDIAQRGAMLRARQGLLAITSELEVTTPGHRAVIFEMGALDAPVAAFDQCGRDLVRDIGLDPNVQDEVVRPVWTPNVGRWISPQIYPAEALNLGQDSRVSARLLVDATGKVTKCVSLTPFNTPAFNQATCAALARAHFAPAELRSGEKVPSYYLLDVTFRMAG